MVAKRKARVLGESVGKREDERFIARPHQCHPNVLSMLSTGFAGGAGACCSYPAASRSSPRSSNSHTSLRSRSLSLRLRSLHSSLRSSIVALKCAFDMGVLQQALVRALVPVTMPVRIEEVAPGDVRAECAIAAVGKLVQFVHVAELLVCQGLVHLDPNARTSGNEKRMVVACDLQDSGHAHNCRTGMEPYEEDDIRLWEPTAKQLKERRWIRLQRDVNPFFLALTHGESTEERVRKVDLLEQRERDMWYAQEPYYNPTPGAVRIQDFREGYRWLMHMEYVTVRSKLADGFWECISGAVRCPLCNRQWRNAKWRYDEEMSCRCPEMTMKWMERTWEPRYIQYPGMDKPRYWKDDKRDKPFERKTGDLPATEYLAFLASVGAE